MSGQPPRHSTSFVHCKEFICIVKSFCNFCWWSMNSPGLIKGFLTNKICSAMILLLYLFLYVCDTTTFTIIIDLVNIRNE